MDRPVAVIDGRRPIARPVRVQLIALYVEVGFARLGVIGVLPGVGEGDVEEDELLRPAGRQDKGQGWCKENPRAEESMGGNEKEVHGEKDWLRK
jgi:hypothetical protein